MDPKKHIELIDSLLEFYHEVISYTAGRNLYSVNGKGHPISDAGRIYERVANRARDAVMAIHEEKSPSQTVSKE